MHLPNERVYIEMRSENASLWIVPANGGEELALLIKAPSSVIKALIAGCPMNLLFGRKDSYLSIGVRILDMPDAPILISGIQREIEEHQALARLFVDRQTPVFLFNEMDVCLAWTNLEISDTDALHAAELIKQKPDLYIGEFSSECSHALDCFCFSSDPSQTNPNAVQIPLVTVVTSLEPWRVNKISFVGIRGHHTITIDDQNEGEIFERVIWASLESVFPLTLHKGAQVRIGKKLREFTDVLAYHEYGSFLIEAKDLSIIQAGYDRDQERRTKGVQKQIKKAIIQLKGACSALTRGDRVFAKTGEELDVVRNKPAHCIILITELMHWGDWQEIETQLIEAMRSTKAFFHLLDLSEFIVLLKASSGKAGLFDYHLMERCKVFVKNGSVHIHSQMAPNSTVQGTPRDKTV
ncbi:MAG: hypothetical protein DU480_03210 [Nitrosomonas sp.]|uniref:hypothetical protein n=1 Tax=Nitrosomonas sp. TaxID=42353 RepID=UPI0032EC3A37